MSLKLIDSYGRDFPYLRLSITDVCNFSCQYCLPNGYQCNTKKSFLTVNEIANLVTAFAELGTWKVRLTGGEPSTRKDFLDIIKTIKNIPDISEIATTTNGYKLKGNIKNWVDAGLTHLNVSVDSLDPKLFHSLTGKNNLKDILEAVDLALSLPIKKVKLNAVLLKNVNSHLIEEYSTILKHKKISIRFIELMQTGDNLNYFKQYHTSAFSLKEQLLNKGWSQKAKQIGSGPAVEYSHPDYQGTIGIIAPYSKDFCDSCNRLRVSSTGSFHLCLFGDNGYSIRHLLANIKQKEELKNTLCELLSHKREKHFLHDGNTGITPHLASIGG